MVALLILFFGCGDSLRENIPGTYAAEWKTEFAFTRDTLMIEKAGEVYQIERRTGIVFQGKHEYKLVMWTGIYDEGRRIIMINSNGRVLSFDRGILRMGTTVYRKN